MAKNDPKAASAAGDSGKTLEQKAREPRDRRARMEAAEPQVEVELRRGKTFRGRAYGPGDRANGYKVSIPSRIAKAMGLTGDGDPRRTPARRGKA